MAGTWIDNPSFFQSFDSDATKSLLSQQLTPGQPDVSQGVFQVSDPIVPDRLTSSRLSHLDPTLYDLRDSSNLMKLLKVLLGASGVGGLRKQTAVARLQNAFSGMHFLDLDRFYGALFGIQRTQAELQPDFAFNPYTDPATPAEWDDLHSRDASYRDRLIKFTRSIPYGASYAGLKLMAEALIGTEVEIYESWNWIDEQNAGRFSSGILTYTWGFLRDNVKTYGAMAQKTYGDWSGAGQLFSGRTNTRNRSEWVIYPKRALSTDEQYQVVRVLNVFKPAGTQFTVSPKGLTVSLPLAIRTVSASSECWEIVSEVTPSANLNFNPYANSLTGSAQQAVYPQARPVFSGFQGQEWTLNGDVTTVTSLVLDDMGNVTPGNDELITYSDGTDRSYQAKDGVMTVAQATAAELVTDGVMTSISYAPGRSSLNTASTLAGVNA
jgi:hypothetical protein